MKWEEGYVAQVTMFGRPTETLTLTRFALEVVFGFLPEPRQIWKVPESPYWKIPIPAELLAASGRDEWVWEGGGVKVEVIHDYD